MLSDVLLREWEEREGDCVWAGRTGPEHTSFKTPHSFLSRSEDPSSKGCVGPEGDEGDRQPLSLSLSAMSVSESLRLEVVSLVGSDESFSIEELLLGDTIGVPLTESSPAAVIFSIRFRTYDPYAASTVSTSTPLKLDRQARKFLVLQSRRLLICPTVSDTVTFDNPAAVTAEDDDGIIIEGIIAEGTVGMKPISSKCVLAKKSLASVLDGPARI